MTYDELMQSILTAREQMLKHCIEANSVTLNGRKYGKLVENVSPSMKPTIFGMAVKADYTLPDDYDFLVQYEPPQPKTNADRIRAMTDKELSRFLVSLHEKIYKCPEDDSWDRSDCLNNHTCEDCWLYWLKQESKEWKLT